MATPRKPQPVDYQPKKRPRQDRAKLTFDALVEACARLLRQHGYRAVSTNHIATEAGVGIASLYEYFPGKDAIVAEVAARLVERVMATLAAEMNDLLAQQPDDALRRWMRAMYETLRREQPLVAVFVYQVPYTNQLPAIRAIAPTLLAFSEAARDRAGSRVQLDRSKASMYLLINLVSSTLLQLVLEPPADVAAEDMLDTLGARVQSWLDGR